MFSYIYFEIIVEKLLKTKKFLGFKGIENFSMSEIFLN